MKLSSDKLRQIITEEVTNFSVGTRSMVSEEDVDVIGISSLATDHLLVPQLMDALREAQMNDVAVVVGGIIPDNEVSMLKDAGVAAVFHPGSSRDEIVGRIASLIFERRGEA